MTEEDKDIQDISSLDDIDVNDEEIDRDSNAAERRDEDDSENVPENNGENDAKRPNKRVARSSKRIFRYPHRTAGGVLPLIPMRGMVIYPGVLLSFDVGREQSIEALRYAMDGRHEIILASQMTLEAFWPDPDQIYRIGTRVFIRQVLELPDDTLKVLAYGLERVEIETFVTEEAHYMVRYTSLATTVPDKTPILDASMRLMEICSSAIPPFRNALHRKPSCLSATRQIPDTLRISSQVSSPYASTNSNRYWRHFLLPIVSK